MTGKRQQVSLPPGFREDPLLQLHYAVQEHLDALYAVLTDAPSFTEVRIKARADGTCYALVKQLGPDGSPMVAFGSGYDALSALNGLEGALHAGNWRLDKPYTGGDRSDGNGEGRS